MPRTGARALALSKLLSAAGFQALTPPPAPRITDLADSRAEQVLALYRELGGVDPTPNLRPGSWDLSIATADEQVVVELDEELHFNRYRNVTLRAPWYEAISWTSEYLRQCQRHERRCLDAGTWGKRWTTPSCEKLFGMPGPAGQIAGRGAPRWKQRALYDAIKDLAAVSGAGPRLIRLSINDHLAGRTLEAFLDRPATLDPALLRDLVEQRTTGGRNALRTSAWSSSCCLPSPIAFASAPSP